MWPTTPQENCTSYLKEASFSILSVWKRRKNVGDKKKLIWKKKKKEIKYRKWYVLQVTEDIMRTAEVINVSCCSVYSCQLYLLKFLYIYCNIFCHFVSNDRKSNNYKSKHIKIHCLRFYLQAFLSSGMTDVFLFLSEIINIPMWKCKCLFLDIRNINLLTTV